MTSVIPATAMSCAKKLEAEIAQLRLDQFACRTLYEGEALHVSRKPRRATGFYTRCLCSLLKNVGRHLSLAVADDALDLEEIVDAEIGILTAIARLLVAAERSTGVPVRVV